MRFAPVIFGSIIVSSTLVACSSSYPVVGMGGNIGGGNGTGGALAANETLCEGRKLLTVPEDPAKTGPWAVGARTITVAGYKTEVWYPAEVGSEAGKEKIRYDIREQLPDADKNKIPDADNPWQVCNCYRDLPLDGAHGPYPPVLFIHGTAGFRTQSLTFMTHWASRGFVVVAADHPGMMLKDVLSGAISFHQADQAGEILDTLATLAGETAFLEKHVIIDHLAMSGHSAGGGAIKGFGGRARVLIPMAAGGTEPGTALTSTLVLGGMDDGIAQYTGQQTGYESSPKKKRLVGLSTAGHLAFSDICEMGKDQGGLLQVAIDHGVTVPDLVAMLGKDGCNPGQLTTDKAWPIVQYASAAVLEETLACGAASAAKIAGIQAAFADVGEVKEDL
ncbi:Putative lipoprotein signal peptide [Minicystis rosea]|nr:Putative lipoprotein signal peptide [Minicystis rosea]